MKGRDITGNYFYVCYILNIFYKKKYMKTLTKGSFLLLTATLSIATVRAQTADEIVSKHVDALGGKAVISSIKSLYMESSIQVMGMEVSSVTSIINGKGFKSETDFNGAKYIQVVTEKSGWGINPMAGQSTPAALTDEQVKIAQSQLQIGGPLVDYAAKGYKVELIGKDTANGGEFKIKMTGTTGFEATYYINTKTYQIDKEVDKISAQGQDVEVTKTFGDYKKTDAGLVMAGTQQVIAAQNTVNITTKKIEVNKTIDPAIFEMPK
jgi:hypothetical protein